MSTTSVRRFSRSTNPDVNPVHATMDSRKRGHPLPNLGPTALKSPSLINNYIELTLGATTSTSEDVVCENSALFLRFQSCPIELSSSSFGVRTWGPPSVRGQISSADERKQKVTGLVRSLARRLTGEMGWDNLISVNPE